MNDVRLPAAAPARVQPIRRWLRVFGLAALLLVLAAGGMHMHVVGSAKVHTFAAAEVPAADCILVPGARIHPDGRPFHLLVDRLDAALQLWRAGKAPCLLLSGRGGGGLATDEVGAMRRWLEARGVPASAIRDDGLGLRTLDSMRRCRDEFGMGSAIVVSNPFHVARAVFLGRQCGLATFGVEAPYLREYSSSTMLKNRGREVLARVWAWLDVFAFGAAAPFER